MCPPLCDGRRTAARHKILRMWPHSIALHRSNVRIDLFGTGRARRSAPAKPRRNWSAIKRPDLSPIKMPEYLKYWRECRRNWPNRKTQGWDRGLFWMWIVKSRHSSPPQLQFQFRIHEALSGSNTFTCAQPKIEKTEAKLKKKMYFKCKINFPKR